PWMARLVVSGIDHHTVLGFDTETEAALRMIEPLGVDHAIVESQAAFLDVAKLAACRHLIHVHRKIWIRHLFFERALEPARPAGGMKDERTALALIQRREEGNALNVVPMKVREENVRVERLAVGFLLQLLAQIAKPGATVKDVDVPIDAHFHAGSIAAITQVFRLRSGC